MAPYSESSRVLHLGNVANTGANMVATARSEGRSWALRELPASPSLRSASAWLSRGKDALDYMTHIPTPDLVHVHYGPNGYYGSLKNSPFVLHLHGTDLRVDLNRPLLGDLEKHSLKKAAAVVVATPDLLEAAREIRPDARWIPNSLPLAAFVELKRGDSATEECCGVFFSARWDDSKGGLPLIELAKKLIDDGTEVVGVEWGDYSELARKVGVKLLPRMTPSEFRAAMAQSSVIVGQFFTGSLTISDLEGLATGRPLVTQVDADAEQDAPLINTSLDNAHEAIGTLLADRSSRKELGHLAQAWVASERSPIRTMEALEYVYQQVLG
ncbi:MAG: glycosyltransferase [Scrofimicrobium sp.]